MNIKITGATGYLGKLLKESFIENGHTVSGINRNLLYGSIEELAKEISYSDIIINLAGAPILQTWTKKHKKIIYESRVVTTKKLVDAIKFLPSEERPQKYISISGINIYKSGLLHNENSRNFDEGFVGRVVIGWEKAATELPDEIQKNLFRTGLIIGRKSKIIRLLKLPFKLGLGATVGNGKQAFPFVHEKDVIRAFIWAVEDNNESGVFNLVAPENITNRDFTRAFAKALNRPAFLFIPSFFFKLILGEASVLITQSPLVESKKLLKAGFQFKYPTIEKALAEIVA